VWCACSGSPRRPMDACHHGGPAGQAAGGNDSELKRPRRLAQTTHALFKRTRRAAHMRPFRWTRLPGRLHNSSIDRLPARGGECVRCMFRTRSVSERTIAAAMGAFPPRAPRPRTATSGPSAPQGVGAEPITARAAALSTCQTPPAARASQGFSCVVRVERSQGAASHFARPEACDSWRRRISAPRQE